VKKISAIFLLSIYLFSAVQLSELLKVNTLVAHFYETRQNEPNISFLDFLVMHYITDDGNTKDNDRDCELPFKSNHNIVANSSSTFILNKAEEIVMPPVVAGKEDFHNYNTPFLSSNFYKLVWNPPRFS
jgi:hypothetical protein